MVRPGDEEFGGGRRAVKIADGFHACIEMGEKYFVGSCLEVPEAVGQGLTREQCLQDLRDSIESVFQYREANPLER